MNEHELIETCFKSELGVDTDVLTGIGDDAAILESKGKLAMSIDSLVEGRHFRRGEEADAIGHKSLAVNLSDLAAMGSIPRWAMLSLSLPEEAGLQWVKDFSQGFLNLAKQWEVSLIGGDLVRGPLVVTVQVSGVFNQEKPLLRSGAQVGDNIYITGNIGGAGVAWHRPDCLAKDQVAAQYCLERLVRPIPRVAEGILLSQFAHAAIDISDGVLLDLSRLAIASGVGAMLHLDAIPLTEGVNILLDDDDWLLPLTAGDDYELLFTLAAENETEMYAAMQKNQTSVTKIGSITSAKGLQCLRDGKEIELPAKLGFDHFDES